MGIIICTILIITAFIDLILAGAYGGFGKRSGLSAKLYAGMCVSAAIWATFYGITILCDINNVAYIYRAISLAGLHTFYVLNLFYIQHIGDVYFRKGVQATYGVYVVIVGIISWMFVSLPQAVTFSMTSVGLYTIPNKWVGNYVFEVIRLLYIFFWGLHSYRMIRKAIFKRDKLIYKAIFAGMLLSFAGIFVEFSLSSANSHVFPITVFVPPVMLLLCFLTTDVYREVEVGRNRISEYLFTTVDAAYILMDSFGNIMKCNKMAAEFFGALPESVVGTVLSDWAKFESEEQSERIVAKIANRSEQIINNVRAKYTDILLETEGFVLYDRYGTHVCVLLQLRDLSKLEEYQNTIDQSKKDVEIANRAKISFMSRITKGVKDPIERILSSVRSVEAEVPDIVRPRLLQIRENASSLLGTMNDIIDIASMESESFEIENIKYDIKEMLNSVVEECSEKVNEENVTIVTNINTSMPRELIGDAKRLRQVLYNMLDNAVKYTASGYIILQIDYRVHYRRVMLNFQISDTGIGIKQENMESIFGVIKQEDSGVIGSMGNGLGLSLCRNIIKLMGGEISVKSAFGRGTTFSFTVEQRIDSEKSVIPFMEHKDNTLLLESDQIILDAEERTLKEMGMPYETALISNLGSEELIPTTGEYSLVIANNHILRRYRQTIKKNYPNARIISTYNYAEFIRLEDKSQAVCSQLFFSQLAAVLRKK